MLKDTSFQGDMRTDYKFTDEGEIQVLKTQDVQKYLKQNAEQRTHEDESVRRKAEFYKYASVPMVVVEELFKKGLNIYNEGDLPAIQKEIDINYPYLKTTNAKGW